MMLYFDNILENEATLPACSFIAAVVSIVQYCMLTPGLYAVCRHPLCTCAAKELTYHFYNRRCPARFEFTEKKEKYREEKRVGVWHAINRSMQKGTEAKERVRETCGVISSFVSEFQHRN